MSIIRIAKKDNPFVMIDRRVFEDARLSWRAKGILAYLLSKPDKWEVQVRDIWGKGMEGRNAVQASLLELQEIGYAKLTVIHGDNGKLGGSRWDIFEQPIGGFLEVTEKPEIGKPINRKSGSRSLSNNKDSLTENSNNELQQEAKKSAAAGVVKIEIQDPELPGVSIHETFSLKEEKQTPPQVPPAPSPRPVPEAAPARPFAPFNMDTEAEEMRSDFRCIERFARDLQCSMETATEKLPNAVDEFLFDQKANKSEYHNARQFRQHFFNWLPRRMAAKNTTAPATQKANLNRLGGDPAAYAEKPLF